MSWASVKTAVRDEIAVMLSGLVQDGAVYWRDGAQPFADVRVALNVLSSIDEVPPRIVQTANGTSGNIDVAVSRIVRFTLTVRAEAISHAQAANALAAVERIRNRIALPLHRDVLIAGGVTPIGEPEATTSFEVDSDDRRLSIHQFDAVFRAEFFDSPTGSEFGTIEHVTGAGDIEPEGDFTFSADRP